MAGRQRREGEPAPDYGPDGEEFSVEVHHGGFFCGSRKDRVYLDGKVDWFDNCKVQYWSFCAIEEIIVRLGYGHENCNVYRLLAEMDVATGLRIVDSDTETVVMKQIAYKVSNFVLYLDIYNSFDDKAWEDIVINPISTLPKVLSPRKTAPERHDYDGSNISDNDGSTDGDFVDSDYEVDVEDDDLFWDNVDDGVVDEGAALGIVVSKGYKRNAPYGKENMQTDRQWDELSSDEDELELPGSDDEGQVGANLKTFTPEDIHNPIFKIGMKFASIEQLRKAITEYSIKHRVEIKKPINDKKRIKAHCDEKCPWNLYVQPYCPPFSGCNCLCSLQFVFQEAWHEEEHVQAETEAMLSQVENPMLSKLQDEASQTLRQTPMTQPLPDSAYIISNLPPARQVHLTTATKGGRTSRSKTGTKKNANTSKKQTVKAKKGQSGQ